MEKTMEQCNGSWVYIRVLERILLQGPTHLKLNPNYRKVPPALSANTCCDQKFPKSWELHVLRFRVKLWALLVRQ